MDYLSKEFSYLLGLVVSKGRVVVPSSTIYIDFKHKNEELEGILTCPDDSSLITKSSTTQKLTCKNENCKKTFNLNELDFNKWNQIESTKKSIIDTIAPFIERIEGISTTMFGNSQVSILKVDFSNNTKMFNQIVKMLHNKTTFKNFRIPNFLFDINEQEIQKEFVNALFDTVGYFNKGGWFTNGRMRGYLQIVGNLKLTNDIDNFLYKAFRLPVQTIRWAHPNIVDGNLEYFFSSNISAWAKESQIKFYPELYKIFTPKIIHKKEMMEELVLFNEKHYSNIASNSYEESITSLTSLKKLTAKHPEEKSVKLATELRGRHIDRSWQIGVLLGSLRIYDFYKLNNKNIKCFFETGQVEFKGDLKKFIDTKKGISEKLFKILQKNHNNQIKKDKKKTSSRLLELETYPSLQKWLKEYIYEQYEEESLVFDTSTTNLSNLNYEDLGEIIEEFDDFDIKPDVVGIIKKNRNLFLIESKVTKLELEDLAQTIGYAKVMQPSEAFLISTEEISSNLLLLLSEYPEILHYNNSQKVKIGKLVGKKVKLYEY